MEQYWWAFAGAGVLLSIMGFKLDEIDERWSWITMALGSILALVGFVLSFML